MTGHQPEGLSEYRCTRESGKIGSRFPVSEQVHHDWVPAGPGLHVDEVIKRVRDVFYSLLPEVAVKGIRNGVEDFLGGSKAVSGQRQCGLAIVLPARSSPLDGQARGGWLT